MKQLIERLGGAFWVACLGIVVLFVFFAAIGAMSPRAVAPLTVAVCVLALAFAAHALRVRQQLANHGNEDLRLLNRIRERRGF